MPCYRGLETQARTLQTFQTSEAAHLRRPLRLQRARVRRRLRQSRLQHRHLAVLRRQNGPDLAQLQQQPVQQRLAAAGIPKTTV